MTGTGASKKKSNSGMTSTKPDSQKNSLTAADICNIIKACKKSDILKLDFDKLHLEFGQALPHSKAVVPDVVNTTQGVADTAQMSLLPETGDIPTSDEDVVDDILDMHLATMDPVGWEKKHLEG